MFFESADENLRMVDPNVYKDESWEERIQRTKRAKDKVVYNKRHRHLVDMLPASLEELVVCLVDRGGGWEVDTLFSEAPERTAQRVPRLNRIVFECKPPPQRSINAWKDKGIQMYCLNALA